VRPGQKKPAVKPANRDRTAENWVKLGEIKVCDAS
jgi:hypothetical protein